MPLGIYVPSALNDLAVDVAVGSPAQGAVFYRGATRWNSLAAGTSGQVLTSGGAAANPTWTTPFSGAHSALSGLTSGDDHTQYAFLTPTSSARNVIQPTGTTNIPLTLKGAASQTGALTSWQDSTAAIQAEMSAAGRLGLGGASVATQRLTILLATASHLGIVVKGAASQSGNLTEWQDNSANILSSVEAGGVMNAGILDAGTTTAPEILRVGHNSSGTPAAGFGSTLRYRAKSDTTTNRDLGCIQGVWATAADASRKGRIAAMAADNTTDREIWRGESDGTLAIGAWGGGAAAASTHLQITAQNAGYKPLVIQGASSQTANLQEWKTSANTVALVRSTGIFEFGNPTGKTDANEGTISYAGFSTLFDIIGKTATVNSVTTRWTRIFDALQCGRIHGVSGQLVFGRGASSDTIFFGENADSGGYQFRGTGKTNFGVVVSGAGQVHIVPGSASNGGMSLQNTTSQTADIFQTFTQPGVQLYGLTATGDEFFRRVSSTNVSREALDITVTLPTATDASRKARGVFHIWDTAAREGFRVEADGANPMIGFLGASAVVRQTLSAASTDLASVIALSNSIRTALINLGLGA